MEPTSTENDDEFVIMALGNYSTPPPTHTPVLKQDTVNCSHCHHWVNGLNPAPPMTSQPKEADKCEGDPLMCNSVGTIPTIHPLTQSSVVTTTSSPPMGTCDGAPTNPNLTLTPTQFPSLKPFFFFFFLEGGKVQSEKLEAKTGREGGKNINLSGQMGQADGQ